MLWRLFRFLFWSPRYTYSIVSGKSHASSEEAAKAAEIQIQKSGGEVIDIAASAMCCADEKVQGGAEWTVYALIRK